MSHFKTWVVVPPAPGPDPTAGVDLRVCERLRPYDESRVVDPWVVGPVTDEALDEFLRFYTGLDCWSPAMEKALAVAMACADRQGRVRLTYEMLGQHYNRRRWQEVEPGRWVEFSKANPDGRWDYWEIGGRYADSLAARAGEAGLAWGNVFHAADIELVQMASRRRQEAITAMAAFTSGETSGFFEGDVERAREALGFPETMTADEWVTERADPRPAVLIDHDGVLVESGKIVWPTSPRDLPAVGTIDLPRFRWRQRFHMEMARAAALGDLIVVVDCHTETAVS